MGAGSTSGCAADDSCGRSSVRGVAQGPGGPNGVEIQIRAENRSTSDTPFCHVGGGMVGDKLKVDAFMDTAGVVSGTATFEDANGNVTDIELDRMFAFSICNPPIAAASSFRTRRIRTRFPSGSTISSPASSGVRQHSSMLNCRAAVRTPSRPSPQASTR
jgi:hypothetical protein